jgi:hypothetical protein
MSNIYIKKEESQKREEIETVDSEEKIFHTIEINTIIRI